MSVMQIHCLCIDSLKEKNSTQTNRIYFFLCLRSGAMQVVVEMV